MSESIRVGVVGAGATGGYLAAQLVEAGVDVTLVARGASLERIREHGLEVTGPDGTHANIRPTAVVSAGDIGEPVDIVLFCVKSYDTADAARLLGPLLGETGIVVCLQNGVKNEQSIATIVDPARVLSAVLYIGAERVGPGVIECTSPPRVSVGPYFGEDLAPATQVRDVLELAGIEADVDANVGSAKWQKFLFNCALNPMTAVTGLKLGELVDLDATRALYEALAHEASAVARSAGAPLAEDSRAQFERTTERMRYISSSMAEDLKAGRQLELDAFTGYVIDLGERHDVPTPVTTVVHGILTGLSEAARSESAEALDIRTPRSREAATTCPSTRDHRDFESPET